MQNAFEAQYGRVTKMVYKGKDKFGNSVYEFYYQQPSTGSIAGRSGANLRRRTFAVGRLNGGWRFGSPNSASFSQPIASADDVEFRGANTDLIEQATAKVGEWLARGIIDQSEASTLIQNIPTMTDSSLTTLLTRGGGHTQTPSVTEVVPEDSDLIGDDFWGGFGGGGGGGFAGPVYRAPDRRVIEDYVKGTLVSLVGTVPDHLVGPAVEKFMQDHKRNFNSETQEIDPQASVEELIRSTQEYKTIHALRPESEDERQWIGQRASEAQRGGLDTSQIESFAINQAATGGDLPDVARAAGVAQLQRSGQAPSILDNQFRQVAQDMFRGVAR